MSRPTVAEIMMQVAGVWSQRSTCPRLNVGAVIATVDGHLLTTGYNGAPRGLAHCSTPGVGCNMVGNSCVRAVHAEQNAILQAARLGVSVKGAVLYCTHCPCLRCAACAVQVGITRVVFEHSHKYDEEVIDMFEKASVDMMQLLSTEAGYRVQTIVPRPVGY